jgi:hypothetical protein
MIRLEKSARSVKIRNPTLNRCHEQVLNWNGSACAMVNQIRTEGTTLLSGILKKIVDI